MSIVAADCPFRDIFGQERVDACPYIDGVVCDEIDVNPGNTDAWCASMIERGLNSEAPGALYQHFKGGVYRIVCEAHIEWLPGTPEAVVYESVKTGKRWIRPKSDFFGRTDEGVKRFTLIEEQ